MEGRTTKACLIEYLSFARYFVVISFIVAGTIPPMAHLLLSLPNGRHAIVGCPSDQNPEEVAEGHGARIYDYCDSKEEAERRLAKDPNGRAFWC